MYLGFAVCAVRILLLGSYSLDLVTYALSFCMIASAILIRALRSREIPVVEQEDAPVVDGGSFVLARVQISPAPLVFYWRLEVFVFKHDYAAKPKGNSSKNVLTPL